MERTVKKEQVSSNAVKSKFLYLVKADDNEEDYLELDIPHSLLDDSHISVDYSCYRILRPHYFHDLVYDLVFKETKDEFSLKAMQTTGSYFFLRTTEPFKASLKSEGVLEISTQNPIDFFMSHRFFSHKVETFNFKTTKITLYLRPKGDFGNEINFDFL